MHYSEKREVRLGDHVDLGGNAEGRVVALIAQAAYEPGYPENEWGYLKVGALVESEELGLVHYPDFVSDMAEPVRLQWRERMTSPLVKASLFLRGDDLKPEIISERLGISSDRQQTRGEEHTSKSGKSVIRRIGLWQIEVSERTLEIDSLVSAVLSRVPIVDGGLSALPSVQEAYLDLFVAEEEGCTRTIILSPVIMNRLNELGLALHLTIGG